MTGIVMGSGGSGGSSLPRLSNPAAAGHILQGREAIDGKGNKISGSIISKAAATYVPGTEAQVIPAGQYLSGDQTIEAVRGYNRRTRVYSNNYINRTIGFRPGKISILLETADVDGDKRTIVCCKYDDSGIINNAIAVWVKGFSIADNGSVAWEIRDNGFKVTVEYPGDFLFDGYYYIHATP